jgi:hypothetical protein
VIELLRRQRVEETQNRAWIWPRSNSFVKDQRQLNCRFQFTAGDGNGQRLTDGLTFCLARLVGKVTLLFLNALCDTP